jgi:hypothetical protein
MKTLSTIAMAISLIFAAPAFATDEHHPEKAQSAETMAPQADTNVSATVKKMQAQLGRIGKAKTDEARQKAMAEHMATMQENMHLAQSLQADMMDCSTMHGEMMGDAAPTGASPDRMQQMEKRMEMMEQMMQRKADATSQTLTK